MDSHIDSSVNRPSGFIPSEPLAQKSAGPQEQGHETVTPPITVEEESSKIQQFCKEMGIVDGSLIARQNSFAPVKWGQKILSKIFGTDSKYSESTHIATVLKVNKDNIQILETH